MQHALNMKTDYSIWGTRELIEEIEELKSQLIDIAQNPCDCDYK